MPTRNSKRNEKITDIENKVKLLFKADFKTKQKNDPKFNIRQQDDLAYINSIKSLTDKVLENEGFFNNYTQLQQLEFKRDFF